MTITTGSRYAPQKPHSAC
uniref:Uncharacterized protein n=1 Tax=Anguilla anguilla TaxID=7936 RepID=A0A0E9SPW3_ANGAN